MRDLSHHVESSSGEWLSLLAHLHSLADNAINIPLLIKQLKTRVGMVPFVGAGMSVPFGFPAWRPFLESQAPDATVRQRIADLLDRGQYEEAAEALLEARGENAFQAAMERTFGAHRLPKLLPPAAILQLPRISSGPVLTTNFDPVLEMVFENARRPFEERILGMNVKALREAFAQSRRVLVKLHGDAVDQKNRVLTRKDYERAYGDQEPLKAVLRFAMQARSLLFLGCSLGNDRTVRVMEALAEELRKQKAEDFLEHYAIVEWPRDNGEFVRRHDRLKNLGIFPVWYPTGQHEVLTDLLAYMAAEAGQPFVCGPVPQAPPHYILRAEVLDDLRLQVLTTHATNLAITGQGGALGVQGMGGVGKTVLAAALTRDAEVQKAFPDGIFWLTVSQQPNLLSVMNQLAGWLPGCGGPFTSEPTAQTAIRQTLAGKRALLILDDVWHLDHAAALNLVSAPARLLITTRKRDVLVGLGAQEFCVEVLSLPDALRMLANWSGVKEAALLPPQATDVAQACSRLPLALAMIGAMVHLRPTAWPDALEFLRSRDLEEFRRAFPDYPYPDLLRAIAVSVDELLPDDRECYLDLAVFPEDEPIPEGPLQVLWGLTPVKTRACMDRLSARSLCSVQQVGRNTAILLHDLQGDYISKQRKKRLPALHTRLLNGYAARCKQSPTASPTSALATSDLVPRTSVVWSQGPDDGYYFQRLSWHLVRANRIDELHALLLDYDWLREKLDKTDVQSILSDFDAVRGSDAHELVSRALLFSISALAVDKRQLPLQLHHRLGACGNSRLNSLVFRAREAHVRPRLLPRNQCLTTPASPEILCLSGVFWGLPGLAISADLSRLISGAYDDTLRVWNLHTGIEECLLSTTRGHTYTPVISNDGTLAVTCTHAEFTLWDLDAQTEVRSWPIPPNGTAMALSDNARKVALGTMEEELTVWDLETGTLDRRIASQLGGIHEILFCKNDEWIVSCCKDGSARIWDASTGDLLLKLSAPEGSIISVGAIGDCKELVCATEDAIRVYDWPTGCWVRTWRCPFKTEWDWRPQVSRDGRRAVGASRDFRVWILDIMKSSEKIIQTSMAPYTKLQLSPNGEYAVWGVSGAIRIWDLDAAGGEEEEPDHYFGVNFVGLSVDSRSAVTASVLVKTWDCATMTMTKRLQASENWPESYIIIYDMAITGDARLALIGKGGRIELWDLAKERKRVSIDAHNEPAFGGRLSAISLSDSGQVAASASDDGRLRFWDLSSKSCLVDEKVDDKPLRAIAITKNERTAVVARSDSLLVYDLVSYTQKTRVHLAQASVTCIALSDEGRFCLIGHSSGILSVWDLSSGVRVGELVGHGGAVVSLSVSAGFRYALSSSRDHSLRL